VKRLAALMLFLDKSGLNVEKVCRGEITVDERGVFTGWLVDFDNPENHIKISEGMFGPNGRSVTFGFISAGESYAASIMDEEEAVCWGKLHLGLSGKYGPIAKPIQEHRSMFAAFSANLY
jgi:hypothetical protein